MQFENGKQLLFWHFHWIRDERTAYHHCGPPFFHTIRNWNSNRQIKSKAERDEKNRAYLKTNACTQWKWIEWRTLDMKLVPIFVCNWIWFIGVRLLSLFLSIGSLRFSLVKSWVCVRAFFHSLGIVWSMWVCATSTRIIYGWWICVCDAF